MTSRNWIFTSTKTRQPIPLNQKDAVTKICMQFLTSTIAPRVVRPFDQRVKRQQCVDTVLKWRSNSARFILRIKDTRDNVYTEECEIPFARIEYCSPDKFLCSYLRHTGEWLDLCFGSLISLASCLTMIADEPHFDVSFIRY